ncbi:MAG: hypothetical protein LBL07_04820 [Tannerella sp.]|jgi:hypothetical protein|nr:hypothetical protein [Tannerella sp.]
MAIQHQHFECKAFLKLKIPQKDNIMGLSWERYEVVSCDYQFHKDVNRNGEVCSGLKGGLITLSIIGEPSDEILGWMFDHVKRFNGEVTVLDANEETLEQVYFEEARCMDLTLSYRADGKPHTVTVLKLLVEEMQIGNIYFEKLSL